MSRAGVEVVLARPRGSFLRSGGSGLVSTAGAFLALVLAAILAPPSMAHDARPLSLGIAAEQAPGVYRAVARMPPTLDAAGAPQLVWPEDCDVQGGTGGVSLVACPGGLEGRAIAIRYPLYNPSITTLVRLETADGDVHTAVLPPDELSWTVPARPTWRSVARDYLALGFAHIWEGPDHLMFVAGLMLLARAPRRILLAVTGFTAAHSITLSLATLGIARAPIAPVEALIALSIVFLAVELARDDPASVARRYPVVVSLTFGLLHGFGFASALGEIGLPRGELALGLVSFNVGVELGQLAFIAGAGGLAWAAGRARAAAREGLGWPGAAFPRIGPVGAYVLGAPAALWFYERTAAALAGG